MKLLKIPAVVTSIKPNKTWVVFGVALVIGLLAALAARSYLANQMAEIEARNHVQMVDVVVAKGELNRGDRLSSENLAVRPLPAQYVHSLAIRPEGFGAVDGKPLAYGVKSGEPILAGMVDGAKASTFSTRVALRHRAMTVPVDEINSISGLLEPGDQIDLILTVDQKGRKSTFPLMQGVAVMATGQRTIDDPKTGERRTYSTVTLDTDPQQAQNIVVAREAGKLTALLRNPQDKDAIQSTAGDLAALLAGRNGPESADAEVPVLYGGSGGRLPAEGLRLGRYVEPTKPPRLLVAPDEFNAVATAISGNKPASVP